VPKGESTALGECFYEQKSQADDPHNKYKPKSNFTPKARRDRWLDHYIEVVTNDIINNLKQKVNINLSHNEERAMRDLLNDDSIVIRPADKGSSVVILNYDDYISTIEKELQDETTYQTEPKSLTAQVTRKVTSLVNEMHRNGYIDKDMKPYMIPHLPHAGQVQANPKVHKQGAPYMLIINGRGHPTEKVAEVAEQELAEHVQSKEVVRNQTAATGRYHSVLYERKRVIPQCAKGGGSTGMQRNARQAN
jgi:hypothetical protein